MSNNVADLHMYREAIDNNEIADEDLNNMIIEKINEEDSYRKRMIEALPEIYNIAEEIR
ncbi:MAG TPA: hypothetical protein VGL94_21480 [Ktedonobacteraceae bacterium]